MNDFEEDLEENLGKDLWDWSWKGLEEDLEDFVDDMINYQNSALKLQVGLQKGRIETIWNIDWLQCNTFNFYLKIFPL